MDKEQLTLRPEVAAFAQAMEERLRANDDKPGWRDCTLHFLLMRAYEELDELRWACRDGKDIGLDGWNIRGEAADVGNFCMMITDVLGLLKATP